MRSLLIAAGLVLASPALAQSLGGGIPSGLGSGISSGLGGGIQSGLFSAIGSTAVGRDPGRFDMRDPLGNGGCAPTQFDLNHTGCRPIREFSRSSVSTYDTSIQGMGPLGNMTLEQTLPLGPGPATAGDPR